MNIIGKMNIIDSHCHLNEFVNEGTLDCVLTRAKNAYVSHLIAIGTDIADSKFYSELSKKHDNIDYTVGIHPCYAANNFGVKNIEEILLKSEKKPVAIGEVGLDFYKLDEQNSEKTKLKQKILFESQLNIAKSHNLPVVVHSREAFDDTLDIIHNSQIDGKNFIIHCFTYGQAEAKRFLDFGAYLSFSGIVTYKNAKSIQEALKFTPLDKILIETDCPYLSPTPHRGKQNEPSFLRETAIFAANLLQISEEKFSNITYENTVKAFNLKL